MKNTIQEWKTVLRHERFRKIQEMQKTGISVVSNKFIYVKKFIIDSENHTFEVRVSGKELYFFVSKTLDQDMFTYSNSYFSIYNIYESMENLKTLDKTLVLNILSEGLSNKASIIYDDIKFEYNVFNFSKIKQLPGNEIIVDEIAITWNDFFYLLALIQEKSNSFFTENSKHPEYKNGIINLLQTLLSINRNHHILESKGWVYDDNKSKFVFGNSKISGIIIQIDENINTVAEFFIKTQKELSNKLIDFRSNLDAFIKMLDSKNVRVIENINVNDEIDEHYNIIKVMNRDVKKGLRECEEDDDLMSTMSSEILTVSGEKYIYVVEDKTTDYKYYLTEMEKGAILK